MGIKNQDFKLIVLDIDGTLLTSKYTITDRTKKVLRNAMEQGIFVTIATGRFYLSAKRVAKEIGINAPIICNDGALIKNIYSNETVFVKPLSLDISLEILDILENYDTIRSQVFMEDYRIYIGNYFKKMQYDKFINSLQKMPLESCINYYKDFILPSSKDVKDITTAKSMLKVPPIKIVVCGDEKDIENLKIELTKRYGDKIFLTTAVKNWIDIVHGDVSKAKGIAILAKNLKVKQEEIIAIGDNINDIPMIKYAGLGVAMGNAPDEVKKAADKVTLSNDEGGVAKCIEKILINNRSKDEKTLRDIENRNNIVRKKFNI